MPKKQAGMTTTSVVLIIVVVILVVGLVLFGLYFLTDVFKGDVEETTNININQVANQNVNTDTRTLVDSNTMSDYCSIANSFCEDDYPLNTGIADEMVTYINLEKGFQADLPFNNSWANDLYKIAAYEETSYGDVRFGPLEVVEASMSRFKGFIAFSKAANATQTINTIKAIGSYTLIDQPEETIINSYPIIEYSYSMYGVSERTDVVVFLGADHNFEIYYEYDADDVYTLEDIMDSVLITAVIEDVTVKSGWESFSSVSHDLSFQYPKDVYLQSHSMGHAGVEDIYNYHDLILYETSVADSLIVEVLLAGHSPPELANNRNGMSAVDFNYSIMQEISDDDNENLTPDLSEVKYIMSDTGVEWTGFRVANVMEYGGTGEVLFDPIYLYLTKEKGVYYKVRFNEKFEDTAREIINTINLK